MQVNGLRDFEEARLILAQISKMVLGNQTKGFDERHSEFYDVHPLEIEKSGFC